MLKHIKALLTPDSRAKPESSERTFELAASALLVEAAVMDGNFDDTERATIERLLEERFDLGADEVAELIRDAEAEVEAAVEIYSLARIVKDAFDHDQRVELIEMLWAVVLADGTVDDYESNLIRRLCGQLYVTDRESGKAKKRVFKRLEAEGEIK